MANPVIHFEVTGKDPQALNAFYGQAFGWKIEPMAGMPDGVPPYAMVRPKAPGGIDGGIGGVPEGYAGHVTFYVGVPSIEDALATIGRLGGSTMMGPYDVPNGPRIALFNDPEGHLVGLVQTDSMRGA